MTAKSIRKLVVLLAAAALWAAGCAGDGSTGGVTAVAPVEPDAAAHGDAAAPPTGGQPTGQPREDAGAPGEDEGAPSPDEGTGEPVEPGGDGLDELRVDALVPAKGSASGQETVTIFGSGFVEGARVLFDESDVQSVFVLGKDRINVTTPPHAPGLVRVTVILPDERSYGLDDAFLYFNAVRVDELDPPGGPAAGRLCDA